MSEIRTTNLKLIPVDVPANKQKATDKKANTGMIIGLVPQRSSFSSDEIFEKVMGEYIFHCRRLEMVKKLRDCLKRNGG